MSLKIFFDMDGVLVDFAGGAAEALQAALDAGDTSSRQFRRLINYDGPDREEPITAEYLEEITGIKDSGGERTVPSHQSTRYHKTPFRRGGRNRLFLGYPRYLQIERITST